jgi:hypothetical protein
MYDNLHPRIVLAASDNPMVIWGKNVKLSLFISPDGTGAHLSGISTEERPLVATIYPNPGKDKIFISLPEGSDNNTFRITLQNVLGKVVLSHVTQDNKTSLNTSILKNGIYFLILESRNKREISKILIHQ